MEINTEVEKIKKREIDEFVNLILRMFIGCEIDFKNSCFIKFSNSGKKVTEDIKNSEENPVILLLEDTNNRRGIIINFPVNISKTRIELYFHRRLESLKVYDNTGKALFEYDVRKHPSNENEKTEFIKNMQRNLIGLPPSVSFRSAQTAFRTIENLIDKSKIDSKQTDDNQGAFKDNEQLIAIDIKESASTIYDKIWPLICGNAGGRYYDYTEDTYSKYHGNLLLKYTKKTFSEELLIVRPNCAMFKLSCKFFGASPKNFQFIIALGKSRRLEISYNSGSTYNKYSISVKPSGYKGESNRNEVIAEYISSDKFKTIISDMFTALAGTDITNNLPDLVDAIFSELLPESIKTTLFAGENGYSDLLKSLKPDIVYPDDVPFTISNNDEAILPIPSDKTDGVNVVDIDIEGFQRLSKLFGFDSQKLTSQSSDGNNTIVKLTQGNKHIFYKRSKDNDSYNISIRIKADDKNDHDMYFKINCSENSCRMRLCIPTYAMYSQIYQNMNLVDCEPYTISYNSGVDIDTREGAFSSRINDSSISLFEGVYLEQRSTAGRFSLPADIAQNYEEHGYILNSNPNQRGDYYLKKIQFTPERAKEFITNILQNSKYLPCLIANIFQKLGCSLECDASEVFKLIISLLPHQFITEFFGSEEVYSSFLTRLDYQHTSIIKAQLEEHRNAREVDVDKRIQALTSHRSAKQKPLSTDLLNGIPNLTYTVVDDDEYGQGIELSINQGEDYIIEFFDKKINIKCGSKIIDVDLILKKLNIFDTYNIDGLQLSKDDTSHFATSTEHNLIEDCIPDPIAYIKDFLKNSSFTWALEDVIKKFLTQLKYQLTPQQLLDILYASAPAMARLINETTIDQIDDQGLDEPIGKGMNMHPVNPNGQKPNNP